MFDEESGMVLFRDGSSLGGAPSSIRGSTAAASSHAGPGRHHASDEAAVCDSFAEVYTRDPLRSITTADTFAAMTEAATKSNGRGGSGPAAEEHHMWVLMASLLRDAERAPQYKPDAIGIARVHKNRRWFISQHAHIQDLLLRNETLRRANVVLQWLEQKYASATQSAASTGHRSVRQSHSEHDAVLLRRVVLQQLRSGQLHGALSAAEAAQDAMCCCILAASELQTEVEPWYQGTSLLPLFGEYGRSEMPSDVGANNDHRLTNLGYLYEDCCAAIATPSSSSARRDGSIESMTVKQLDAWIAATLCGHGETLKKVFADDAQQPQWQHQLWAILRSALVTAASKTLVMGGAAVPSMKYLQFLDTQGRSGGNTARGSAAPWSHVFADQLFVQVCALLQPLLTQDVNPLGVEEQLQIRIILQFFATSTFQDPDTTGCYLLDGLQSLCDPSQIIEFTVARRARLVSHVLLCLDLGHSEQLLRLPLQGQTLTAALCAHVASLQRPEWHTIMASVCGMVQRIRSPSLRAEVYGAFVFAERIGNMDRGVEMRSVEDQETLLLQYIRNVDVVGAVHDAMLKVLSRLASEASNNKRCLLTHNAASESLLWESMRTDDPAAALGILRRTCGTCLVLWQQSELDALETLMAILRRHILPKLVAPSASSSTQVPVEAMPMVSGGDGGLLTATDVGQLNFWGAVLRVREISGSHMKTLASLKAATERVATFKYEQQEQAQRRALVQSAEDVLRFARYAVDAHGASANVVSSCCAWSIRCTAEAAALVFSMTAIAPDAAVVLLRTIFALVEQFDQTSQLMTQQLLSRADAEGLFTAVRTARAAFGLRRFQHNAEAARSAAGM